MSNSAVIVLETIRYIFEQNWNVHTICGLSNISYGLHGRSFINQSFALMALANGLDSIILNPLDRHLMMLIRAGVALQNMDAYCKNFTKSYKRLNFHGKRVQI